MMSLKLTQGEEVEETAADNIRKVLLNHSLGGFED